jgi:hypothetical protein
VADTALDQKTGQYILKDAVSGKLKGFTGEEAAKLIQGGAWQPVSLEEARPFVQERSADENISTLEGTVEGVQRGLTGGLPDLLIQPGSKAAEGLALTEQGAPGAMLGGEIAGTVAPFLGPLKAGRLLTAPGILEAGGEALTKGLRRGAPGVTRMALSRAAGVGSEVTGQLAAEETRRAHLEARPANYTRVLGGYGLGAMIPALVLGGSVGALEGGAMTLGQRALKKGAAARDLAKRAGVDQADAEAILMRETGHASPGVLDEIHSQRSGIDPTSMHLYKDSGPAGEVMRQRMIDAPRLAEESAARTAEGINSIRDSDDLFSYGWSGRQKRELVEKWMKGDTMADQATLRETLQNNFEAHNEIAAFVTQQVRSKTELGKKIANEFALGKGMDVDNAIRNKLALNDDAMMNIVSGHEFSSAMSKLKNPNFQKAAAAANANPAWRQEVDNLLKDIEEGAGMLEDSGKGYVGDQAGKLPRIGELVVGVRSAIADADRVGGMIEMDVLKKRLGDYAKAGQHLGAGDAVAVFAREQHEHVRQLLENPMYWGERAANAQRETNALFQKRLARETSFHKGWFKDAGVPDPRNPWRNQIEATPDSVKNILGGVSDINDPAVAKWREHIAESKSVIDRQLADFEHLSPEEIATLRTARDKVDDTVKSFNETIALNKLVNDAKKLRGANAGEGTGFAVQALAGHAIGGLPGLAMGMYMRNKLNPGTSIVARAHLERILRQNEARVERAVKRLMNSEVVPSLGVAQAATRLADEPREVKQEGYQKTMKETHIAAQDPTKAREVIAKELEGMDEHMPGLIEYAAAQVVNGMRYAYDKAPAKPITTLTDGEFISPVSDTEMHIWELVYEAALDPTAVLEQAAEGELTPEALDAAEAMSPEFVAELRMNVIEAIQSQELSYEKTVALSTLFKMPVDMTTDPEYIRAQQLLHAARTQAKAGPKNPNSFSETGVHKTDTMSKSDSLGVPPA